MKKRKANVLKIANDQREYGEEVKKEVKMPHIQCMTTLFTYENCFEMQLLSAVIELLEREGENYEKKCH